jgi:hypothetical protein
MDTGENQKDRTDIGAFYARAEAWSVYSSILALVELRLPRLED